MTAMTYLTDALADRAVDFIEREKARPFFLYLAFNAVHTPMHATDKYLARFADITDSAAPHLRRHAVGDGRRDRPHDGDASRREARGEHARLLLQRQRRTDDARHDDQRLEQCTAERIEAPDVGRGHPRAVHHSAGRVTFRKERPTRARSSSSTCCRRRSPPRAFHLEANHTSTASTCCRSSLARVRDRVHEALYWRLGGMMAIRKGDWKLVKTQEGPLPARPVGPERSLGRGAVQPRGRYRRDEESRAAPTRRRPRSWPTSGNDGIANWRSRCGPPAAAPHSERLDCRRWLATRVLSPHVGTGAAGSTLIATSRSSFVSRPR